MLRIPEDSLILSLLFRPSLRPALSEPAIMSFLYPGMVRAEVMPTPMSAVNTSMNSVVSNVDTDSMAPLTAGERNMIRDVKVFWMPYGKQQPYIPVPGKKGNGQNQG